MRMPVSLVVVMVVVSMVLSLVDASLCKYSKTVFMWLDYTHAMDDVKTPRDRRSRRAEATRLRIIEAAAKLFDQRGYGGTTIEAVASEADVAVETVYARFKNKRNLLAAYLDTTIVGD